MANPQDRTTSQLAVKHPSALIGGQLRYGTDKCFIASIKNGLSSTKAKKTLTVDTYTGSADYAFTVQGEDFIYTEDGDTNENGVAAKLADLINTNPGVTIGFARVSGAVITIEAVFPDVDFVLSTGDAKLTAAVVAAAANGSSLDFGCAILRSGNEGVLPGSASLTKRKITAVGVTGATTLTVDIAGSQIQAAGATAGALRTSLLAALGALSVLLAVTVDSDDVVIEAATAGQDFNVTAQGTGIATITIVGDSLDNQLAGFTYRQNFVQGDVAYEPGSTMDVVTRGEGFVVESANPTVGMALYIDASTGEVYDEPLVGRVSTAKLRVDEVLGTFAIATILN